MQTNLQTIATDATIADAVAILSDTGVSSLPVIDRHGRAVGVVSTRDVLRAEHGCPSPLTREHLFAETRVLEIMQPWPTTVGPDEDVRAAARDMLYLNTQRLFVEYDGALVGVVSQTDIVGALATANL